MQDDPILRFIEEQKRREEAAAQDDPILRFAREQKRREEESPQADDPILRFAAERESVEAPTALPTSVDADTRTRFQRMEPRRPLETLARPLGVGLDILQATAEAVAEAVESKTITHVPQSW